MLLKADIVHSEKPDGICSLTFVVDGSSRFFLDPSIFPNMHLRSVKIINIIDYCYGLLIFHID